MREFTLTSQVTVEEFVDQIDNRVIALDLIKAIDLKMADAGFTEDVIRYAIEDLCKEMEISIDKLMFNIFGEK